MDNIINTTESDILELLARFKFLVISQMQPILGKSTGYVRQQLARLTAKGYIKSFALAKPIKAQHMFYLTENGAEIIAQHERLFSSEIKLPIGAPLLVKDYDHRKNMISLNIALYYHLTGLGFTIREQYNYFDKQGDNKKTGNLEAKTKLLLNNDGRFFIPDGVLILEKEEKKIILLVEMYCDNSSTRVLEQLHKHMLCIAAGSPGTKFGIAANPFVLSAFEHDGIKQKTIERVMAVRDFHLFQHLFYFGTLADIQQDCGNAWHSVNGELLSFT